MLKKILLIPLCVLACAAPAFAQPFPAGQEGAVPALAAPVPAEPLRSLELSTGAQSLTGGYGNWHDVTLRGTYGMSRHTFQAEASVQRRFNEDGAFIGLGDTYTFNDDWYGSLAVGAGGHWLNPRTGILVGANRYSNPLYRRTGVNVGIFHNF
jgi:hypothetical protein